jgi:lysozyme
MSRLKKGGAIAAVVATTVIGFEGMRLLAYPDPATKGAPYTVCAGETKGIRKGMRFTRAECDAMLVRRLEEFAAGVERCVPSAMDMPVERYAAHVSLAWNIGVGGYCKSSIARLQNAGNTIAACDKFLLYNKAAGREMAGLTKRRQQERAMCVRGGAEVPVNPAPIPEPPQPPIPDLGENTNVPADWSFLPWLLGVLALVGAGIFFWRRRRK